MSEFALHGEKGPLANQKFELVKSIITLGRESSSEVEVTIASPTISRQHARITHRGADWFVEDLGSRNGTFLNGQPIGREPRPLKTGDRIRLGGETEFVFKSSSSVEAPSHERPVAATMMVEDLAALEIPAEISPPELIISIAGSLPQRHTLSEETITLGRASDNDIVVDAPIISRYHACLGRTPAGYQLVVLPSASNPILFKGRPLMGPHRLMHGDSLRIGTADTSTIVSMTYETAAEAAEASIKITFGEKNVLQLGRDPENDVVLDSPTVSRFHAQIERIGQRHRIRDLRSSNGTFVNEQRISGDTWVNPRDTIRLGSYRFVMGQDELAQYDESGGVGVDALNLNKWVRKDFNILKNISVIFRPREFIVIVGQSGGGKSTLLDAIAGYRPATHGQVLVNDVDAYRNFDAIRNNIGYVPQKDIIHMELTIYQALDYAARLRMPADTTPKERHRRISEVLEELDLTERKDVQVSGLSGGQQKRVSIGVELLTKPGLFFLDEATSGLDPGTETSLMQLLRRLADQGRTIVLVTHATKNVMLADKVVFLARGGYLAWFGPPDEALAYFDQYRTDQDRRIGSMEFDQIYGILDNPANGKPADWAERFQQHPAYQQYVIQPLQEKYYGQEGPQEAAAAPASPVRDTKARRQISSIRQFLILSSRNLKILTRDRTSMILMLLAAPFLGLLDALMGFVSGGGIFDFNSGDMEQVLVSFFIITIFAIFVGGLAQMREIVKELEIYKRERLVNLKILPYVFSKIWIASLLAVYQGAVIMGIHYLVYDMPGGITGFLLMYISMVLLSMAGMMLGLLASSLSPNASTAPMIVIMLLMPQVILSGSLVPIPSSVSTPASSRWGFEAFIAISGVGSDVAKDVCWQLPKEVRQVMSIEEATQRCNCLGINVLKQESCNFPGSGQYYDPVIERPEPSEPAPLRDKPPEPELPPEPQKPQDQSDQLAMAEYSKKMDEWRKQVEDIQDDYRAEMNLYQIEADYYKADATAYQERLVQWKIDRAKAIEPAIGLIESYHDKIGYAFVDKEDTQAFITKVFVTWSAQSLIIVVIIVLVMILVKRKDVI